MSYFKILSRLLGVIIIIVPSCKKNSTNPSITANAIVINSGDPAADGCGWLIKITATDSTYSPLNLAAAYQTDSLKVSIVYTAANTKFQCGQLPGNGISQIRLDEISRQ